jgi:hypothetical protein
VRRNSSCLSLLVAMIGLVSAACESGGVGDPCIPEDEYRGTFQGFNEAEVNVESRSFQCETRLCLVSNFRGRVSCPYGNDSSPCYIPGTKNEALDTGVIVKPQLTVRRPEDAVYCSCRCDGPDPNAQYCECPSGYSCEEQIQNLGFKQAAQLVGSYCIKNGTKVEDPVQLDKTECNADQKNCGEAYPYNIGAK